MVMSAAYTAGIVNEGNEDLGAFAYACAHAFFNDLGMHEPLPRLSAPPEVCAAEDPAEEDLCALYEAAKASYEKTMVEAQESRRVACARLRRVLDRVDATAFPPGLSALRAEMLTQLQQALVVNRHRVIQPFGDFAEWRRVYTQRKYRADAVMQAARAFTATNNAFLDDMLATFGPDPCAMKERSS